MTSSRTLKALEPHMFSLDAMQMLATSRKHVPSIVAPVDKPLCPKIRSSKLAPELWVPSNIRDKLFWCFYYVWKGEHDYTEAREHAFRIDKETKITAVEKLRAKTDDMKRYGLKLADVESELVTAKRISYKGLCGLCLAYDIGIIYVRGRTYIDVTSSDKYDGLIVTQDGTTGVKKSPTGEIIPCIAELETLKNNLYFIQDFNKPIRAISAYSLGDLTLIAKKLDVALIDEGGKRKLKKKLYEDIIVNL